MKLSRLLTDFLEYLEIERGRSQATVRNYSFYLGRFLAWFGGKEVEPATITEERVRTFRLWLARQMDREGNLMQKNTQNYHLIALRAFLKYLAKRGIPSLAPEKIELAKQLERQVEFLDAEEIEKLLDAPVTAKEPPVIQKRDRAILETLFSTGLRVAELASLKRENVAAGGNVRSEFPVTGKGSKRRVVFLSPAARTAIASYLSERHDDETPLFLRHDRGSKSHPDGLTPRSIQRLVQRYAQIAGITKHVSPHTLRHSYATDLLANGADLRAVQSLLGHSSVTTTQIYTHVTDQHLKEVHQAFHGRRRGEND